ncbi:Cilia- and flagella-associated protein 53 [Desmophyllum pertusum]|uniref:Cilia- and flagella-associated protein 53 n=1 Tax=Desmophyllum pertusum TaxID=174260 RepID=A0A9W9ZP47_9CNID|nr:Cilia- and flagella-associated protein 53 [Desmophyllum pertusum]
MMVQHVRRCREFTGPTPHSVAIKAKPTSKRPVEHLILETRRKDELREQAIAETKYQKQCDLKSEWEKATDKRIKSNTISRRVEKLMQRGTFSLEDRRERLREMLLAEEQLYIEEMEAKEETTLERQAKMRERAKFLKEKREQERLQIVQEKLDQRWRDNCEELRSTLSQRHQDEVFVERHEQLKMKDEHKKKESEIDSYYADLWAQDIKIKSMIEEQTAREQIERNRETLKVLQTQIASCEKQREDETKLKEMEADWLKEEARLREEEEKWLQEEKLRKQKAAKKSRQVSIRLKKEKEAKEKQEELAMDMKILEKLLDDTRNEVKEETQRKREMREENLRFMQYCAYNRKEEADKEKELERVVNEEVEKKWAQTMQQYKLERDARQKLLANVMESRKQQIGVQKRRAEEEHESERAEREALQSAIEEHKRLEGENQERIKNRNVSYQRDLDMQIDYQRRVKAKDMAEEEREFRMGQDAEAEYQRKLKEALERPTIDKVHPMRIMGTALRSKSN